MNENRESDLPILTWIKGFGMGAADVVPGFSGGTVALLAGIYEKLVTAISRFDRKFLHFLRRRDFLAAAQHIDLRFLLILGFGIGCGFIVSMLTLHKLLKSPVTSPYVLSVFLGLILGCSHFVLESIRLFKRMAIGDWLLIGLGIAAAVGVSSLTSGLVESPPLWFVFLCAVVAICAMILPGISGAMILMILGVYPYLLGIGHNLIHREDFVASFVVCLVFGAGCIVGLLSFSKFLRWLFAGYPAQTLSVMLGLMLGSVVRLWPYQLIEGERPDAPTWLIAATVLGSAFVLYSLTKITKRT